MRSFPLLDYCRLGMKDKLEKCQNQIARVFTGANYDAQSADLFRIKTRK